MGGGRGTAMRCHEAFQRVDGFGRRCRRQERPIQRLPQPIVLRGCEAEEWRVWGLSWCSWLRQLRLWLARRNRRRQRRHGRTCVLGVKLPAHSVLDRPILGLQPWLQLLHKDSTHTQVGTGTGKACRRGTAHPAAQGAPARSRRHRRPVRRPVQLGPPRPAVLRPARPRPR